MPENDSDASIGPALVRSAKIALGLLTLILGGVAFWAWISSGSAPDLPFGYDGFD